MTGDLMPLLSMMGVLSRVSTGSSSADMFLALVMPLFISWLGTVFARAMAVAASARLNMGFTRRIEHVVSAVSQWWINEEDPGASQS